MPVKWNNYGDAVECSDREVLLLYPDDGYNFMNTLVAEIANLMIPESIKRGSRGIVLEPIYTDPQRGNELKELVHYVAEHVLREVFREVNVNCLVFIAELMRGGDYVVFPEIRSKEGIRKFIEWIEEWYSGLTDLVRRLALHFVNVKLANAGSIRIEPKSLRRRFGYTPQEISTLRKTLRK